MTIGRKGRSPEERSEAGATPAKFLLILTLPLTLTACMSFATSGAEAVYNHHSLQKNVKDQYLTLQAYQSLDISTDHFKKANVNVATFNRVVLLTGQVPEPWQKQEAEARLRKIEGIDHIYNLVTVEPNASKWEHLHDTWLTTKIKTKLIASNEVDASLVKVITEKGTVYLLGIIPAPDADAAARLAQHTNGVKQVVKAFSYITITRRPILATNTQPVEPQPMIPGTPVDAPAPHDFLD